MLAADPGGEAYLLFGNDGSRGFVLIGPTWGDGVGWDVALLEDVNGDGIRDYAVSGANAGSKGADDRAGEVYVLYGCLPVAPRE